MKKTLDFPDNLSSVDFGKQFFAKSVEDSDPELAERLRNAPKWRETYDSNIVKVIKKLSENNSFASSGVKKSLEYLYDTLIFTRNKKSVKLSQLDTAFEDSLNPFNELVIVGKGFKSSENRDYSKKGYDLRFTPILYRLKSKLTQDKDILETVSEWSRQEFVEQSCLRKVKWVLENKEKIDVHLENIVFVVFGANAALGPYESLLESGSNITIIAIDLPRKEIQSRLVEKAKLSKAKVILPFRDGASGADLITDAPELIKFLSEFEPKKRMIFGNYAYADGPNFVRLVAAMDAITTFVTRRRGADKSGVSYLMSPTDIFLSNTEIKTCAEEKFAQGSVFPNAVNKLSKGKFFQENFPESNGAVLNNTVVQQGPNYMLAKKIQQFRSILVYEEKNILLSSNIAPASSTESVVKNKIFKAAFGGAQFFGLKIFYPEESNTLMTLELFYDLVSGNKSETQQSVLEMFLDGAAHGKMFRYSYKLSSYVEISAVLYFANQLKKPLLGTTALALAAYKLRSKL